MTKRRDPLLNARPSGSSPRWTSGKILIQVLVSGVLLAFFVAVAIPALHLITPSKRSWKDLGDLQIVSEPTPGAGFATHNAANHGHNRIHQDNVSKAEGAVAIQVYEKLNPSSLREVQAPLDWSDLLIYDLNEAGKNHGILLGTRGWKPSS
jgi:hypothetical protein